MKRVQDLVGAVLLRCLTFLGFAFLFTPIIMAVLMSFDARTFMGPFPPTGFSLRWYEKLLNQPEYLQGFRMSLLLATVSTAVSIGIGITTATALHRYPFRGRRALEAFFLSPLIIPGVITGFALLLLLSSLGIVSGFPRLIAGHIIITAPYTIRTTLAALSGTNKSYREAALSLGATEWYAFWDVTFPLIKTGVAAGGIFAFAFSLDDVSVSIFLSDFDYFPLSVALLSGMRANFDLTLAAAAVLLMILTVLLVAIINLTVGLDRVVGLGVYGAMKRK